MYCITDPQRSRKYLSIYGSTALLLDLGSCFSFLIFYTVGRTPWTGDQPVARPLPAHRTAQIQNKRTQKSMPQVGFEPTIPVFERAKTVHALDRAATVIGCRKYSQWIYRGSKKIHLKTDKYFQHDNCLLIIKIIDGRTRESQSFLCIFFVLLGTKTFYDQFACKHLLFMFLIKRKETKFTAIQN
jgi:hypothetical protein